MLLLQNRINLHGYYPRKKYLVCMIIPSQALVLALVLLINAPLALPLFIDISYVTSELTQKPVDNIRFLRSILGV